MLMTDKIALAFSGSVGRAPPCGIFWCATHRMGIVADAEDYSSISCKICLASARSQFRFRMAKPASQQLLLWLYAYE